MAHIRKGVQEAPGPPDPGDEPLQQQPIPMPPPRVHDEQVPLSVSEQASTTQPSLARQAQQSDAASSVESTPERRRELQMKLERMNKTYEELAKQKAEMQKELDGLSDRSRSDRSTKSKRNKIENMTTMDVDGFTPPVAPPPPLALICPRCGEMGIINGDGGPWCPKCNDWIVREQAMACAVDAAAVPPMPKYTVDAVVQNNVQINQGLTLEEAQRLADAQTTNALHQMGQHVEHKAKEMIKHTQQQVQQQVQQEADKQLKRELDRRDKEYQRVYSDMHQQNQVLQQ